MSGNILDACYGCSCSVMMLSATNCSFLVRKDRCVEGWHADTGTAFHMTDRLSHMKDLKSCHKNVKRDWYSSVACEVALSGTLEFVFVAADSEFSVELENVLYSPDLGYNLFSPSAEFDGESWNHLGV